MWFQALIKGVQASRNTEELRQPIDDLQIPQIFVVEVERGLTVFLQMVQDVDLKPLQNAQPLQEFLIIEGYPNVAASLYIGQLPLPGCDRDLVRNIAVDSVARQDDFGASPIGQYGFKNARIVIVKVPEPCNLVFAIADRPEQVVRICITLILGQPEQFGPVRIGDEVGIERLTMARHAAQSVEIGLKEV